MEDVTDDSCWSGETYKLAEIPEKADLPTLVQVCEGIYSTQDCSTFSQGDIIKIDASETVEMAAAHFAVWKGDCYKPQGEELYVPTSYRGRVRVCPLHGTNHVYGSVEELIRYFPKFVKVVQGFTFNDRGKMTVLRANDVLELLKLIGTAKTGAEALRVRHNGSELILRKDLKARFSTLDIEVDYTVDEVMKFKMPQCIKFIGQDISLFTSKDFQEAVSNISLFDGYFMLNGRKKTRTVLVGHYKSYGTDGASRFSRRSAVVLPLDNPDVASIEVRVPTYMDYSDYEVFVLKHFSECDISQRVDGLLYIDFSNKPGVVFPKDLSGGPPVIPPRRDKAATTDPVSSDTPPPRPPKPGKCLAQKKEVKSKVKAQRQPAYENHHRKCSDSDSSSSKKPTKVVSPVQQGSASGCETGEFVIGDIFGYSETGSDGIFMNEEDFEKAYQNNPSDVARKKIKGIFHKIKKSLVPKPSSAEQETGNDDTEAGNEDDESGPVYDYVDEKTLLSAKQSAQTSPPQTGGVTSSKIKTAVVQPFQKAKVESKDNTFKSLNVSELAEFFKACALDGLAQIVKSNMLDGDLFSGLTDNDLKKEPFCLNNLDVKKVRRMQQGWSPSL